MNYIEKLNAACDYIKKKINAEPKIAIILGSGLGSLADEVKNKIELNYSEIPNFPVSTVEGHAGKFIFGDLNGKEVIMMQGRFHFYEGYDMNTVTFPIRVLKLLGVEKLIVTNAAGGVNTSFKAGDLMLIKDHINFSGTNPLIGPNLKEFGPRFPDMSNAYCKNLIEIAKSAAQQTGVDLKEGVYFMMTGPSYETPAEIRMIRTLGGDAVGMSTVPEVIVANHSGMKVLGISCITNMAAGILEVPLSHEEVIETSNLVKDKFKKLVSEIVARM
ncbi:purine-nucleoside phosphorylase [Thermobrachium celere]|uniref:Purine nucleoside phosphorylase n=1 Tax=Thermobrachium celere DSM 8682 TaxID=941824 RepID=R7RSC6_9CLOT|nr:purine-nucleoside phosphorylase [Thermobrachium celere]GFR34287.1 purine nucleoside phosphorylase [Thermobrachium celere]CDF58188.1 Purine nucleoside phosphorylase [Thermobrachium celere DSM 8682]